MASRKAVEKVAARVFCHSTGGGKPVTVFTSQKPLSASTQKSLASHCEWESVMVTKAGDEQPRMSFHQSGEPVSFCAHAALGGAYVAGDSDTTQFLSAANDSFTLKDRAEESATAGMASLNLQGLWQENPVSHQPSLQRLLREHVGLTSEHLVPKGKRLPTNLNASIGILDSGLSTLVHVNSKEGLLRAATPRAVESRRGRRSFAAACGGIDDSTGLFLYTSNEEEESGAWLCRHFPRSMGYPEDPACGEAAAALACSLFHGAVYHPVYKFYQGSDLKESSLIEIVDMTMDGDNVSFDLRGRVEIDSRETIEVEDE